MWREGTSHRGWRCAARAGVVVPALAACIAIALAVGLGMRFGEAAVPGPGGSEQPPDELFNSDPDDGIPWDFDLQGKRDNALRLQREQ